MASNNKSPSIAVASKPITPRILVLLATYNGEKYLLEQLASLGEQHGVQLTLAVSDDCSSDQTKVQLEDFKRAASFPVILHFRTVGSGSAARNFFSLIRDEDASGFDAVALCDQDDIWHTEKLAHAYQTMTKASAAAYASSSYALRPSGARIYIKKDYPVTPTTPTCGLKCLYHPP